MRIDSQCMSLTHVVVSATTTIATPAPVVSLVNGVGSQQGPGLGSRHVLLVSTCAANA